MDILRRELNEIYESQQLGRENLDSGHVEAFKSKISMMAEVCDELSIITDASADRCYIYSGKLASLLGLTDKPVYDAVVESSDEDAIYTRMHPEDLPDKRMLEYEYFKFVDPLEGEHKISFKATCRIRIRNLEGRYLYIDNSTQVLFPSPSGKIWLILCRYELSSDQTPSQGINPAIVCTSTGEVRPFSFAKERRKILTPREKEILLLIRDGKPSKQIADQLGISIHTVNRHRQNIIEKLSVNNSVEAISAAITMKLL